MMNHSPRIWHVVEYVDDPQQDDGTMVKHTSLITGDELVDVAVDVAKQRQGFGGNVVSIAEVGHIVGCAPDSGYTVHPETDEEE